MLRLNPATFAVCLLPLALVACGDTSGTDDPRTQPPLVRSATVVSAVDTSRAFTGVVVARVQSDLGFRVQGKILERLVDTGQTVKRGQPLMRLDPVDLGLQAQAQQQAVAAAKQSRCGTLAGLRTTAILHGLRVWWVRGASRRLGESTRPWTRAV